MISKRKRIGKYEYWYYDEGDSSDVIIILHGIGSSKEFSRKFFKHLYPKYRLLSIDLPGHNGLPGQGVKSINDMLKYLDLFVSSINCRSLSFIGYSLGGYIALRYVNRFFIQRNINKVVLWSTPIHGTTPFVTFGLIIARGLKMLWRLTDSQNYYLLQRILSFSGVKFSLREIRALTSVDLNFASMLLQQIHFSQIRFKGRLLMIYGDKEVFISVNNIRRFVRKMKDRFEIVIVPGGGHLSSIIGKRDSLNLIAKFFKNG